MKRFVGGVFPLVNIPPLNFSNSALIGYFNWIGHPAQLVGLIQRLKCFQKKLRKKKSINEQSHLLIKVKEKIKRKRSPSNSESKNNVEFYSLLSVLFSKENTFCI